MSILFEYRILKTLNVFATYGFGERLVRRSVFEVDERVVEELITRHPLLRSSLQQPRQQLPTAARNAGTSWQLQRRQTIQNIITAKYLLGHVLALGCCHGFSVGALPQFSRRTEHDRTDILQTSIKMHTCNIR